MHFRPPLKSSRNIAKHKRRTRASTREPTQRTHLAYAHLVLGEDNRLAVVSDRSVCRACRDTSRRSTACAIPSTNKPAIFMDFSATPPKPKNRYTAVPRTVYHMYETVMYLPPCGQKQVRGTPWSQEKTPATDPFIVLEVKLRLQ